MLTPTRKLEIIAIRHSDKLDPIMNQRLLSTLTPLERQKNERFLRWEDREKNLLGRVIVRSMILERFDIKSKDISFTTTKYGKPCVEGLRDFHFNISHSKEWVVAICSNSPIGIDIEEISTVDLQIAEQFFSSKEIELLTQKPVLQRNSFFYDLWTLKESFIKADGRGLYIALNSFSIMNTNNEFHILGPQKKYNFRQYSIDKNYKLSVCGLINEFPESVNIMEVNSLIKKYFIQLNGKRKIL